MSSRRAFIKTVVLATGAVFTDWHDLSAGTKFPNVRSRVDALRFQTAHEVLRDKKRTIVWPAARGNVDCLIIGGGVSGLVAAWRLKKEGKSYVILDGEPVIGGAARSGNWHGQKYSMGSGYFVTNDGTYKEIYEDLGLKLEKTGEDALWFGPDTMFVDWWTDKGIDGLPVAVDHRDAFKRFRDAVIKFDGIPEYPLTKASPEKIAKYDAFSAQEYLKQFNSSELQHWMNLYNYSSCGAPSTEINAYCFLNFYSSEFGDSFDLPRYSWPGGIVGTTDRLRKYIGPSNVHTDALVLRVENTGGGVTASYLDAHGEPKSIHGGAAIMAAQKRIVHNIVPEMPKEQNDLCAQVRYAPYITVNLLCKKRLLPDRAFDIWFRGAGLMFTDMVDGSIVEDNRIGHADRTTGLFTYCVYCPQPESERKNLQDAVFLAQFAQRLADNIEENIPAAREAIDEMHVFAWGHTMVIPAVNTHSTLFPGITQPVGKIFFANTDNDLSPSVESGIINGHGAAELVIAALK